MTFGLATKKDWDHLHEKRERRDSILDAVFETVLRSQNQFRKMGMMSESEYLKWRLEFDMQRYDLDHLNKKEI